MAFTPMIIGTVTLGQEPATMTVLQADKDCASVKTWDGVGFFSWGPTMVGKEITLTWPLLSSTEFDSLDTLFQADAAVTFDPGLDSPSSTYTVEITSLTGNYALATASRSEVKMVLLVLAVL